MATHLILAPHHDDAEFGLGIAIQNWLGKGEEVVVLVACTGDYHRSDGTLVDGETRRNESIDSFKYLGVAKYGFQDWFKENRALDADYGLTVAQVEQAVNHINPTDTYVCLPSFNQDHRVLYEATITAFRPGGAKGNLHAYEYPGNQWHQEMPTFGKRYHRGNSQSMGRKATALKLHETQFKGRVGGVDIAYAYNLGAIRGHEIGVPFAEVTFVIKEIAN